MKDATKIKVAFGSTVIGLILLLLVGIPYARKQEQIRFKKEIKRYTLPADVVRELKIKYFEDGILTWREKVMLETLELNKRKQIGLQ